MFHVVGVFIGMMFVLILIDTIFPGTVPAFLSLN